MALVRKRGFLSSDQARRTSWHTHSVPAFGVQATDSGDRILPMAALEPIIFVAIKPNTRSDQEKLSQGLRKLMTEDPTFRTNSDEQARSLGRHCAFFLFSALGERLANGL